LTDKERIISVSKQVLVPIHPEGRIFVALGVIITVVMFWAWESVAILGVLITIFVGYFFRNPERFSPEGENLVLSPADGTVVAVGPAEAPYELELNNQQWVRVSIFLSIFDVHINRFPVDGQVHQIHYTPGKFINAASNKSSEENERNIIEMKSISEESVIIVQIAGLIARRIVCDATRNQEVVAGEEMGIIRFGSRVDIYLPETCKIKVKPGQTMIGGETIIGELKSSSNKNEIISGNQE